MRHDRRQTPQPAHGYSPDFINRYDIYDLISLHSRSSVVPCQFDTDPVRRAVGHTWTVRLPWYSQTPRRARQKTCDKPFCRDESQPEERPDRTRFCRTESRPARLAFRRWASTASFCAKSRHTRTVGNNRPLAENTCGRAVTRACAALSPDRPAARSSAPRARCTCSAGGSAGCFRSAR